MTVIHFVSILSMLLLATLFAGAQGQADLVLVRGKVWTENPRQPEAEAIAIQGNRILAIGTTDAVLKLAGPHARVIDLAGRRVVPGFNDAHVHFYTGGESLAGVDLRGAKSPEEMRKRIDDFAHSVRNGEWILDGNWDHEKWMPVRLPTHELIDKVTLENPVFVNRSDGHMALANALAMKLAGVDKNTKDVPGGVIVRDAEGNPTGIFKDAAKDLITRAIPPPSGEHIISCLLAAQRYAAENGVTSVQDMGVLGAGAADTMALILRAYQTLLQRSQLQVRVSVHFPLPDWQRLTALGVTANFGNDKLRIGSLKSFADGSLGSTTAWFYEPYTDAPNTDAPNTDAPNTSGIPSDELLDPEQMYARMRGADRAGLQIAVHAIGDRANHTILGLFERLEREDGGRDRRLRIEHAQHLLAADIPRFAKLQVIASMQPYHCIDDGRWAEERIGVARSKRTYAFRSLLDAGATLAFGSDWWVAPMDPLMGIYAAVTRRTLDDKHPQGWVPEQKISAAEAVRAYTVGSAYAEGEEDVKGSIELGKLADLVVLSEDIFHIDPVEIQNAKVDMTVFDGAVIFERK